MSCQDYELSLGDYVDGTIEEAARAALTAHLTVCPRCRALVADFTAIRLAARDLEPVPPSPHVWTRLSAALDEERGPRPSRAWSFWQTVAAAGMAATLVLSLSWIGGQLARATAPVEAPVTIRAQFDDAEADYTSAIAGLESITRTEQGALDMDTADVLQANLTVIDSAITESRAALATEPDSRVAQESLFDALRSKLELLQDTVALINEMRKGNPDGAARIASGLNQ